MWPVAEIYVSNSIKIFCYDTNYQSIKFPFNDEVTNTVETPGGLMFHARFYDVARVF